MNSRLANIGTVILFIALILVASANLVTSLASYVHGYQVTQARADADWQKELAKIAVSNLQEERIKYRSELAKWQQAALNNANMLHDCTVSFNHLRDGLQHMFEFHVPSDGGGSVPAQPLSPHFDNPGRIIHDWVSDSRGNQYMPLSVYVK